MPIRCAPARLAIVITALVVVQSAAWFGHPAQARAGSSPFTDIAGSTFEADIEWLYAEAITYGCAPTLYCPNALLKRGQMASFIVRAFDLTEGADVDAFVDDEASSHEADINRIAYAGITTGCSGDQFCPNDYVTRGQMASFLARAVPLTEGGGNNYFRDDNGTTHEADIDRVAAAGITTGCETWRFCPSMLITRGQMAGFLHRVVQPIPSPPFPAPGPGVLYVTVDGDDRHSCLDEARPCRTIGRAVRQAIDGDTVEVGPGTFTDQKMDVRVDLTIVGAPNHETVIDVSAGGPEPIFSARSAGHWLELDGLVVRGYRGDASAITGSYKTTIRILNSLLTDNESTSNSGAVRLFSGTLLVADSTFSDNHGLDGGAIQASGTVDIRGTTFAGNSGTRDGGAIAYQSGSEPADHLSLTNSTIADNDAEWGGAISVWQAPVYLFNSTITRNVASHASGGIQGGGAVYLRNSIVAGNQAPEIPELWGLESNVASIIGVPSGLTLADILDPAGLAANGGPTETIALVDSPDNPAVDAGNNTVCGAAPVSGVDQRGLPRITPCDIGAFEVQP